MSLKANHSPRHWPLIFRRLLPIWWLSLQAVYGSESATSVEWLNLKHAVVTNYAAVVSATYQDTMTATRKLQAAIQVLLARPSAAALAAAREAWLAAHGTYSQSEAFRFYDGPIDQVEATVNSWPMDENYLDYVAENPEAGIINSASNFPALSRELIVSLNEKEGKKNISTGFHAVEFLLWGQPVGAGAGNRSWHDYADGAKNVERRRECLRLITELLLENLETVAAAWAGENPGNYRSQFVSMDPDAALAKILKGAGALSGPEMAGERLTSAYETKEREEQQDCFSDNSRNDLIDDAIGIQNVYLGSYTGANGQKIIQGPGIHNLLLRADAEFAGKMAAQVRTAVASARDIPPFFDQAILGVNTAPGRIAIKNAIKAFQTQSDMIAQAAKALSIKLNL
jgi:putative iron-regulated protein